MKKGQRSGSGVSVFVKGKNIPVTPKLHQYVVQKMGRLDKYHDRLHTIEVEVCTEDTRAAKDHNHVEATTHVLGKTIRVASSDADMHAAIDQAVDKLYRQLNRQKERLKAHHGAKLADVLPSEAEAAAPEEMSTNEEGRPPRRREVRTEYLDMKPQFEEEAIEELEEGGHNFYVFLNARSENVNVLYRHEDGGYGLIQPVAR